MTEARTTAEPPQVKKRQLETVDPKGFAGSYHLRIRRRKIFHLRMLDKSIREIAAETGLSVNTVMADLRVIDEALQRTIDKGQANAILNERLSRLEMLSHMAVLGAAATEGNEQIGYLNSAAKFEEQIIKLLQDAGVLRKATGRHELTGADRTPLIVPSLPAPKVTLILQHDAESEKNLAIARGER